MLTAIKPSCHTRQHRWYTETQYEQGVRGFSLEDKRIKSGVSGPEVWIQPPPLCDAPLQYHTKRHLRANMVAADQPSRHASSSTCAVLWIPGQRCSRSLNLGRHSSSPTFNRVLFACVPSSAKFVSSTHTDGVNSRTQPNLRVMPSRNYNI